MGIDITANTITIDRINSITLANDLILKCTNDKDISSDDIEKVFTGLGQNVQKILDVSSSVFRYAIRNNKTILAALILTKLDALSDSVINLGDLERAIRIVSSFINYINNGLLSRDNRNELSRQIGLLQVRLVQKKMNITAPPHIEDFELSDAEIRLSALISSMIELVDEHQVDLIQTESVKTAMRHGVDKVSNTFVKFSLADKSMSDRLNEKFNRFLGNYKADKKTTSYDKIVKDSVDLSRMLKNVIGSSIVALLIPGGLPIKLIAGVLVLLIQFARNKRTDNKYKGVILNDLKFEIKIVQEKIKDAESKGDNVSKYKLMRVENQISRAIDRINFNLTAEQS